MREQVAFLEGENARLKEEVSLTSEVRSLIRITEVLTERVQKLEEENAILKKATLEANDAANRSPSPKKDTVPSPQKGTSLLQSPAEVHARLEGLSRRWNTFRTELMLPLQSLPSRCPLTLSRSNSVTSLHSFPPSPLNVKKIGLPSPSINFRMLPVGMQHSASATFPPHTVKPVAPQSQTNESPPVLTTPNYLFRPVQSLTPKLQPRTLQRGNGRL